VGEQENRERVEVVWFARFSR